jgi:hypothetical protein
MDRIMEGSFIERRGHVYCQVREVEKEGWGLLGGWFYTTLNLEMGRHYVSS